MLFSSMHKINTPCYVQVPQAPPPIHAMPGPTVTRLGTRPGSSVTIVQRVTTVHRPQYCPLPAQRKFSLFIHHHIFISNHLQNL